ncbi:MAG TPA: hypothetical protein VL651_13850, partial [Bacteroidia bacterium]|nr:hypothetical protein [Bacteroidia bacterium]
GECNTVKLSEYEFKWLSSETIQDLNKEDSVQCLTFPVCFIASPLKNGWSIILKNKVLLHLISQ